MVTVALKLADCKVGVCFVNPENRYASIRVFPDSQHVKVVHAELKHKINSYHQLVCCTVLMVCLVAVVFETH